IGPNGAGKSTFLRVLAGLHEDFAGKVTLDGEDIKRLGRKKLAQRLAILPQGAQAPADTTVEMLVDYGRFPYRGMFKSADQKKDREAVEWALTVTHLKDFRRRHLTQLSGGERQRAWIAMALAQQPRLLLLDEPTTYLDIAHQLEVMQIVRQINHVHNMTVIMVLHDINHALQYADEIVIIKGGVLYAQGTPADILTVETIGKVFNVRADIFFNSQGVMVLSPLAP
ncbi:MAG: ABC transporter ATP-binding protein, partial [Selenomonadaceae bacterium]|nr:ABC transporter ATP-binding protein [Selenomonadaceae bacterium]